MKVAELISPSSIFLILALPAALCPGVAIGIFNPIYAAIIAATLVMAIIVLLRLGELIVMLVIAVHILVDSYLGLAVYQIALLMALVLLFACYFGQSANHPWTRPRWVWLWLLFLILTIVPAMEGAAFSLTNSIGYYLEIIFSPFIMFWLGNIIAKDASAVRRVFQWLSFLAALFAVHTIIQATTGKFLFESARGYANLVQASNFQIGEGVSRASSFFGNPNGDGIFLATCFFLPLGLFIESERLWAKLIYLLEMLSILLALMFTYSNGSWIAALTGLLVFIFLVGRVHYSVLLLLLVTALAVVALTVFPSLVAVQLSRIQDQGNLSLHLGAWQTAMRVIAAYPLFGVGLGNQAYLSIAEHFRVPAQTKLLAEPDNSYLQWGAVAGIPVMLIFLVLLALVFWFSWRNWLAIDTRYRPLFAGGIVALLALSINSLTVDGWTSPIDVQYLGWLIAGVVASPLIRRCLGSQSVPPVDGMAETAHVQVGASWMDKAKQGSQL